MMPKCVVGVKLRTRVANYTLEFLVGFLFLTNLPPLLYNATPSTYHCAAPELVSVFMHEREDDVVIVIRHTVGVLFIHCV